MIVYKGQPNTSRAKAICRPVMMTTSLPLGSTPVYSPLRPVPANDCPLGDDGREWSKVEGAGVPQTESRCDERTLAALESLSFLTLSKKASSLFIKYFSIDSSCFELWALSICSFCTNSEATPPSASVNCTCDYGQSLNDIEVVAQTNRCNSLVERGILLLVDNRSDGLYGRHARVSAERSRGCLQEGVRSMPLIATNSLVCALQEVAEFLTSLARAVVIREVVSLIVRNVCADRASASMGE